MQIRVSVAFLQATRMRCSSLRDLSGFLRNAEIPYPNVLGHARQILAGRKAPLSSFCVVFITPTSFYLFVWVWFSYGFEVEKTWKIANCPNAVRRMPTGRLHMAFGP